MKRTIVSIGLILLFSLSFGASAQTDEVCAGLLAPRLVVGQLGDVTPGNANNMRSEPSKNGTKIGQIPAGGQFAVLAGPNCADGFVWWQVNYEGTVGWTVEGADGEYWLEPIDEIAPTAAPCITNLIVGEPAQFDYYLDQPILKEPNRTSDQIGMLTNGDKFDVISEPVCLEDYTYVQIQFGEINGWLQDGVYEEGGEFGGGLAAVAYPIPLPLATVVSEPGINRLLSPTPTGIELAANTITAANAAQVKTIKTIGDGTIQDYDWSPDGKQIAVAGTLDARIYDTTHFNVPPHILNGHSGVINRILYSPDGKLLVTASGDGTVRLWNPTTFETISVLEMAGDIRAMDISPDSTLLAATYTNGPDDDGTDVWDISDPTKPSLRYKLAAINDYIPGLQFTPDKRYLIGIGSGGIDRWDMATGEHTQLTDMGFVFILSWNMNAAGTYLATFVDEMIGDTLPAHFYTVRVFNLETGKQDSGLDLDLTQPGNEALGGGVDLRFAPDESHLLINLAGQVEWVDPVSTFRFDITDTSAMAFSPDGSFAAFGESNGGIRLFNVSERSKETGAVKYTSLDILYGISGSVKALSFSADGKSLAGLGSDESIRVWNVETYKRLGSFRFNSVGNRFALSPDNKTLYGNLSLWDTASGKPVQQIDKPGDEVSQAQFTPEGQLLLTVRIYGKGINIVDGQTGALLFQIPDYPDDFTISSDGKLLAYSKDRVIHIVNLADGSSVRDLDRQYWGARNLHFSPDNRLLLVNDSSSFGSSEEQPSLLIWDIASGDLLANIPLTTNSIIDFNVYGSQGGHIAWNVWNYDNDKSTTTIHMVNLVTQRETISQPIAGSFDIAVFSADESVLAVAGDYDGTIHLLDTNSLTEITTLQGHTDKVTQMVFSSDGARLYSASNDNSVRVWGIKNE